MTNATDNLAGYSHASAGLNSKCHVCQQAYGLAEADLADYAEAVGDEGGFSRSACDVCGSILGGDRYAVHAIDDETGEIEHFDVCLDCVTGV